MATVIKATPTRSSKDKRNYGADLLRVIAMVMVVTLHFLGHGGVLDAYPISNSRLSAAWTVETVGLVAVNCYVLISGYFLVRSNFRMKKLFALVAQVVFYSLGIYILLISIGEINPTHSDTIHAIFPITNGMYWFVTMYVGMYILSPFMNVIINQLSQRTHLSLALVFVLIFSVWPSVIFTANPSVLNQLSISRGYSLTWFITLYFIAAYLGKYYRPSFNVRKHLLYYIYATAIAVISILIVRFLTELPEHKYVDTLFSKLTAYNSILILASSLTLFILFINISIKKKFTKWIIATLAPLTFSVYLITEEPHVRNIIWDFFAPAAHAFNPRFLLYAVAVIGFIYITSSAIDWVRLQIFKRLARLPFIQSIGDILESTISRISNFIIRLANAFLK